MQLQLLYVKIYQSVNRIFYNNLSFVIMITSNTILILDTLVYCLYTHYKVLIRLHI